MPRSLSSASLSKYLIGGVYYDFLQYVKSDKELAFEIRVKDEVMIYCQKNLILRISHRKNASDNITMLNPRYYTNRKKAAQCVSAVLTQAAAAKNIVTAAQKNKRFYPLWFSIGDIFLQQKFIFFRKTGKEPKKKATGITILFLGAAQGLIAIVIAAISDVLQMIEPKALP